MYTVNTCCCYFSLKTGTKIIAVVSLVYCLIMLAVYGTLGVEAAYDIEEANHEKDTSSNNISLTSTTTTPLYTTSPPSTTSTPVSTTTRDSTNTNWDWETLGYWVTQILGYLGGYLGGPSDPVPVSTTNASTQSETDISSSILASLVHKVKRSAVTPSVASLTSSTVSPDEVDELVILLHVCVVAVVLYMVGLVASSLLVHGVRKDRPGLIVFWLVWQGIQLMFNVAELVVTAYLDQVWVTVAGLVLVIIAVYFWLVVTTFRVVQAREYQASGAGGTQ